MSKTILTIALCCLISPQVISAPRIESCYPALATPNPAREASSQDGTLQPDRRVKVADPPVKSVLRAAPERLPIYFIRNQGQLDPRVRYYARTGGSTVYFTDQGIYFSLVRSDEPRRLRNRWTLRSELTSKPFKVHRDTILLKALHASKSFRIQGAEPQATKFNYFFGKDPGKWRTNVPAYRAVVYSQIYPGIDLKFYATGSLVEYDVIVKPGADPSQVKLAYEGIQGLKLDRSGNMIVELHGGSIVQKAPRIIQRIDEKDVALAGAFRIEHQRADKFTYGFEIPSYDRTHGLIIDPQIAYSTYLGGSYGDTIFGIAVDSAGAAYVTGDGGGLDFPTTIGAFQIHSGSAFVSKVTPDGSALVYSTYLGDGACHSVAVNAAGEASVACETTSTDFPMVNPFQAHLAGGYDAVVARLSADGSALLYSTYLGGSGNDSADGGIALDPNGNIYVAGVTNSLDFPLQGPLQPTLGGGSSDGFIAELNPSGSSLIYSTYLGGSMSDSAMGLAVDETGAAYVAGITMSADFPTTPGALDRTCDDGTHCDEDGFVSKIQPGGGSLAYSTYLGGNSFDGVGGIATDDSGCAYIAGTTFSSDFPVINPIQPVPGSNVGNVFVSKLSPDGSSLIYSTYLGGSDSDSGSAIAIDSGGAAYVVGRELSRDFPTVDPLPIDCGLDAFVTKVNPEGTAWVYSTCLGGNWFDEALAVAVDSTGAACIAGDTYSPDFPILNAAQPNFIGGPIDGFVTKIQCDSIDSPEALENSGSAVFTVHLCSPAAVDGTVDFATADGTALAGVNYVATSGTLLIPAGSISGTIPVPLIQDGLFDANKTFLLHLTNPVNLNLPETQSTAVILDADSLLYDGFDNGVVGWTTKGEWHEGEGMIQGTATRLATAFARLPWFPSGASGCSICTVETDMQTAGGLYNKVFLDGWFARKSDRIELVMKQEQRKWVLKQYSGGKVAAKSHAAYSITPGVNYHIRLSYDGSVISLIVDGTTVLTMKPGAPLSGNVGFKVKRTTGTFGPIRIY